MIPGKASLCRTVCRPTTKPNSLSLCEIHHIYMNVAFYQDPEGRATISAGVPSLVNKIIYLHSISSMSMNDTVFFTGQNYFSILAASSHTCFDYG